MLNFFSPTLDKFRSALFQVQHTDLVAFHILPPNLISRFQCIQMGCAKYQPILPIKITQFGTQRIIKYRFHQEQRFRNRIRSYFSAMTDIYIKIMVPAPNPKAPSPDAYLLAFGILRLKAAVVSILLEIIYLVRVGFVSTLASSSQ